MTVRQSTYDMIAERARKSHQTADEFLTVNLTSGVGVSKGKRVGVASKKRVRLSVDGQDGTPDFEELKRKVRHKPF